MVESKIDAMTNLSNRTPSLNEESPKSPKNNEEWLSIYSISLKFLISILSFLL